MADEQSWILGGVSTVAATVSALFAWWSVKAQRAANAAASSAARSVDKFQRIQVRPALVVQFQMLPTMDAGNSPQRVSVTVRNVGHGTAVIERIRLSEFGNVRLDYETTHGKEKSLSEDFDSEIVQRLVGVRAASIPGEFVLRPLTETDRALEVGANREIFFLDVPGVHATRTWNSFSGAFRAQINYRSLAGEEFETEQQFASIRGKGE